LGDVDGKRKTKDSRVNEFANKCGRQQIKPVTNLRKRSWEVLAIVGGEDVLKHSWPWQIMLRTSAGGLCGGTLIDAGHVLTAAHCIKMPVNPYEYKVHVGMHRMNERMADENTRAVQKIWVHEQYNPRTQENDIAVIRLAKPVTLSDTISVICLPGPESMDPNERVWVAGWGTTSSNGPVSQFLRQTFVHIMPNSCERVYQGFNKQKQICAGIQGGGRDTCQGDSGGPLMYEKNGVWYLNGVVSFGKGCAAAGYPGVYTRVKHFLPWIQSKTGGSGRKGRNPLRRKNKV